MTEGIIHFLDNLDEFIEPIPGMRRVFWAVGKPQPRSSNNMRFGKGGSSFFPAKKMTYFNDLKQQFAITDEPWAGPVKMSVCYSFDFTQQCNQLLGWALHDVRPDVDNLCKPLFDVLSKAVTDDAKICVLNAVKIRFTIPSIVVVLDKIRERQVKMQF